MSDMGIMSGHRLARARYRTPFWPSALERTRWESVTAKTEIFVPCSGGLDL